VEVEVAHERVGEGPPLVLVHGASWIRGCGSRSSPLAVAHQFEQAISRSELVVIPGARPVSD
jgi:hypothetical protein